MTPPRNIAITSLFAVIIIIISIVRASEIAPAEAEFLRKQHVVFQLLWSSNGAPKNHPEIFERLRNYKLEDVRAACDNHSHAEEFENHLRRVGSAALQQDEPHAEFRDEHQTNVARLLFNVLRCAKSFEEFAALAGWSRGKVAQLAWIHALATSLSHRKDSKALRLPNLYEIVPHYFFETQVLVKAYRVKAREIEADVGEEYTIEEKHYTSTTRSETETEPQLNYFRNDVALNQFYFQLHNHLPFWLRCEEKDCNGIPRHLRGELVYYYVHKMLLARYELERLSLALAPVEDIDWEREILTGYRSRMTHLNGWPIPDREPAARLPVSKYSFLEEARRYESRLAKAIDLDESLSFNGLCNALEGNADSPQPKVYGSLDRLYRRLLGFAPEATKPKRAKDLQPFAALEMPWTSLRDPGFFRMIKRILDFGLRFKRNLPAYTCTDLGFDGLRIDYLHSDKLVTYFDSFDSAISHPPVSYFEDDRSSCGSKTRVKLRQQRLNHKPFAYEIGVTSETSTKAIVKIFLGPKLDVHGNELQLEDSIEQFYELDRWIVDLKPGSNKLDRRSTDSPYFASDPQSSEAYHRQLLRALRTSDENLARQIVASRAAASPRIPRRFMLPRGTQSGLALRLVLSLHGLAGAKLDKLPEDALFAGLILDGRDLGFPFDRPWTEGAFERLRNFIVKDVRVFHEDFNNVIERD